MSVPYEPSLSAVAAGREYILWKLARCRVSKTGRISGDYLVTYSELADQVGYEIEDQYDGDRMGNLAARISDEERAQGGPMLSALVVTGETRMPGVGFFKYAVHLGLFSKDPSAIRPTDAAEMGFWHEQCLDCVRRHGRGT